MAGIITKIKIIILLVFSFLHRAHQIQALLGLHLLKALTLLGAFIF